MEIKTDSNQISNNRALKFLIISSIFLMLLINLAQAERLPTVSGDSGAWGTVLNNFLLLEHTQNGTHRNVTIAGDLTITNASNNIALLFNSSARRLGIGTANPLASLHINTSQSTSFEAIRVTNSGATDSSFMFFQRPGSPSRGLIIGHQSSHVDIGTDYQNTSYIAAQGDVSQDIGIQAGNGSDDSGSVGRIYLAEHGGNVGIGTSSLDSKLTILGNLSVTAGALLATSSGKVGIGTNAPLATLHVNGTGFLVTNGSGSNYTAFFVNSTSGNVGTGTTNPQENLDVSASQPDLALTWTDTANYGRLLFYETTASLGGMQGIGSTFTEDAGRRKGLEVFNLMDDGFISFRTTPGGVTSAERIRIEEEGKVGINTTHPAQTLTVQGTFNVTSQPTRDADFLVNSNGAINITGNLTVGTKLNPTNLTMYSPNGTIWGCGVDNTGTFSCSMG